MDALLINEFVKHLRDITDFGKYELHTGTIQSVDETDATCDVQIGEITIYGVRLRAAVDTTEGVYLVPAVNSTVIIGQIDGGVDYTLIQASKVDKALVKIGAITMTIASSGVTFNNGNLGGLPMLLPLIQKLNALESKVNTLTTSYNGHTHVAAGSATSGPSLPVIGTLPVTQRSDLENTKIKQ